MTPKTREAFDAVQGELDRVARNLDAAEYRDLLEELESEMEIRGMAADDDERNAK